MWGIFVAAVLAAAGCGELDNEWCDARPYEHTLPDRPTAQSNMNVCWQQASRVAQLACTMDDECRMPLGIDIDYVGVQIMCYGGRCTMPCTPEHEHPSHYANAYLILHTDCSKTAMPPADDQCLAPSTLNCMPGLLAQYKQDCCNAGAADHDMYTTEELTRLLLRACCLSPTLCGAFVDYW